MTPKTCVSASLLLLLAAITGFQGCHGCEIAGLVACRAASFVNTTLEMSKLLTTDDLEEACRKYTTYMKCAEPFVDNCSLIDLMPHNVIDYGHRYLCSQQGRAIYYKTASCWAKPNVPLILNATCVAAMRGANSDDVCDSYNAYITCATTTVKVLCSDEAEKFVRDVLQSSLRPFTENRTCPFNFDPDTSVTIRVAPTTSTSSSSTTSKTTQKPPIVDIIDNRPADCNSSQCLKLITPAYDQYIQNLTQQGFTFENILAMCPAYATYVECMRPIRAHCAHSGMDHMANAILKIQVGSVCEEGPLRKAILGEMGCWNDSRVQDATLSCFTPPSTPSNDSCSYSQKTLTCLAGAVQQFCDEGAQRAMIDYLNHTSRMQASYLNLNCNYTLPSPTSNTTSGTSPTPPTDTTTTATPTTTTAPTSTASSTTSSTASTVAVATAMALNVTLRNVTEEEEVTTTATTVAPQPEISTGEEPVSSPAPSPLGCRPEVDACFRLVEQAFQNAGQEISRKGPILPLLESVCPKFQQYAYCVAKYSLSSCNGLGTAVHKNLRLTMGYVCSPMVRALIKAPSNAVCWNKTDTTNALFQCAFHRPSNTKDTCGILREQTACMANAVRDTCDARANSLWRGFLVHQVAGLKYVLNVSDCSVRLPPANLSAVTTSTTTAATTTPTTAAPRPVRCFECHGRRGNYFCPPSGSLTTWAVSTSSCDGYCYSRTDSYVPGVVFRGCYPRNSRWLRAPFSSLPLDAFVQSGVDVWIFCDSDRCNTDNMTPFTSRRRFGHQSEEGEFDF